MDVIEYRFTMCLTYHQCLDFYRGTSERVRVVDNKGRAIIINYRYLVDFLTPVGIHGSFVLKLDPQGRFISLKKIN